MSLSTSNHPSRIAVLLGATGQVGSVLLSLLLNDTLYEKVVVVVRRRLPLKHPNLEQQVIDFDHLERFAPWIRGDDVFCCLGTSSKDPERFRKVDMEYPCAVAQIGLDNGARRFFYVSATGANGKASNRYLRGKGEAEERLKAMDFRAVHIARPSMISGHKDPERPAQRIARWLSFLFIGPMKKYTSIEAGTIARALLAAARNEVPGRYTYTSDVLQKMGKGVQRVPPGLSSLVRVY